MLYADTVLPNTYTPGALGWNALKHVVRSVLVDNKLHIVRIVYATRYHIFPSSGNFQTQVMLEAVRCSRGRRDCAERPAGKVGEDPPRRTYGGTLSSIEGWRPACR